MKRQIVLYICILISTSLFAQSKFTAGKMKIGKDIFEVGFVEMYPIIAITNISKGIYPVPHPTSSITPLAILDGDMMVDTTSERQIVYDVLRDRLKLLKENREKISVSYVFYQSGKVMNITFSILNNTLITPDEIGKIDQRLRLKIKVTFKGEEYKAFPAIFYNARRSIIF